MSLFERLYTYRQKEGKNERENFLTELLAGMLRAYPQLQTSFMRHIGLEAALQNRKLLIQTQSVYPEGRPDIVITCAEADLLVLVECKLEAQEGDEQLTRYEAILARSQPSFQAVVFLTKYYEGPRATLGKVHFLRWHDVYRIAHALPAGELLDHFQEYLQLHNLHYPMTFTPTDLLALENIQAVTRKMDEVLTPIEPLFRAVAGGYYQKPTSRNKLHGGWYGLDGKLGGATVEAGFWSHQSGAVHCYCLVEGGNEAADEGPTLAALRDAWQLPADTALSYLERSEPVLKFLTGGEDGADAAAMRKWFEERLQEVAQSIGRLSPNTN